MGETFDQVPIEVPVEVVRRPRRPSAGTATEGRSPGVYAFILSFGVIFVAELGDKSQLMAMTLATRFKPVPVLAGITVATATVHLASVAIGVAFGATLPTDWITLVAGIAFLFFAAWTLRGDELTQDDEAGANRAARSAFVATVLVFFIAELGDKTMLATVTLATREGWFGTWLGSTVGMVAADALAIGVGALFGKHLPERVIRILAALLFVVFGVLLIVEAVRELT